MANPISADLLPGARAFLNATLNDTCTIARTGATVACRVDDDVQNVRVEGLPHFLPLRRWHLTLPDSTDVRVFDALSVTGKGVYLALIVANPQSYSVSTDVYCIQSGAATVCTTQRDPDTVADLAHISTETSHLNRLVLYPVGDYLLTPVSQQFMADTFGVTTAQAYRAYAAWPNTADWVDQTQTGEAYPVALDDTVILPNSGPKYTVRAVENFKPHLMALYLEVRD